MSYFHLFYSGIVLQYMVITVIIIIFKLVWLLKHQCACKIDSIPQIKNASARLFSDSSYLS